MLITACPSCASKLGYTPENVGKNTRCPKCATVFVIAPPPPPPEAIMPVELLPDDEPMLTPAPEEESRREKPSRKKRSEKSDNPFAVNDEPPPDEDDDLDEEDIEHEKMLRGRRISTCNWLAAAGMSYYVLAVAYLIRTPFMVFNSGGGLSHEMGALMGGLTAIALSIAMGVHLRGAAAYGLRGTRTNRAWHDDNNGPSKAQKVKTAGVLAIISGGIVLMGALFFLGIGVQRLTQMARGGGFENNATVMPMSFLIGFFLLAIGTLSLVGGIKGANTR